jgi:hypothetical protein
LLELIVKSVGSKTMVVGFGAVQEALYEVPLAVEGAASYGTLEGDVG